MIIKSLTLFILFWFFVAISYEGLIKFCHQPQNFSFVFSVIIAAGMLFLGALFNDD